MLTLLRFIAENDNGQDDAAVWLIYFPAMFLLGWLLFSRR